MTTAADLPRRNSPESQAVAAEIRAEAARQGVSHAKLALAMGTNGTWVHRRIAAMTADVDLNVPEIARFAAALGVDVSTLLATWLRDAGRTAAGGGTYFLAPAESVRHQGLEPRTR